MRGRAHWRQPAALALLLLLSWRACGRRGGTVAVAAAANEDGTPDSGSSSTPDNGGTSASSTPQRAGTAACPAQLLAFVHPAVLGGGNATGNATASNTTAGKPPPPGSIRSAPLPAWPPAALTRSLTCTMEVSLLALALPGSGSTCSVVRIKNNLLSELHSWQLVWAMQQAGALEVAEVAGGVLLPDPGGAQGLVRIINAADGTSIAARGGEASLLLQMEVAGTDGGGSSSASGGSSSSSGSSDDSSSDNGDGGASSSSSTSGSSESSSSSDYIDIDASPPLLLTPGIDRVFLNGLQCTRLPLIRDGPPGSSSQRDCAATVWQLDSSELFPAPRQWPPGPDSDDAGSSGSSDAGNASWGGGVDALMPLDIGANSSSNGSQADLPEELASALRWLSCTSHFCCGLQVVQGAETTAAAAAEAAPDAPAVTALDGNRSTDNTSSTAAPDPVTATSANATAADPASLGAARGIGTAGAPELAAALSSSQPGSSSTELIAGVAAGGAGLLLLSAVALLIAWRRRRAARQQRLKQLMAGPQPLVPNGSGGTDGAYAQLTPGGQPHSPSSSSLSSQDWQQRQRMLQREYLIGPHSSAAAYFGAAAAAAASSAPAAAVGGGVVWRAGSWQDTGATTASSGSNAPGQLWRSSSSPAAAGGGEPDWADAAELGTVAPNHAGRVLDGAAAASAAAGSSSSMVGIGSSTVLARGTSTASLVRGASGASSEPASTASHTGLPPSRSLSSTWGSLRRLFSGGQRRKSSTTASLEGSLSLGGMLGSGGQAAAAAATGDAAGHDSTNTVLSIYPAAHGSQQHLPLQLQLVPYRQQLQLIQETAPLTAANLPLVPGGLLRSGSGQHAADAAGAAAALTHLPAAVSAAVSRRVSPVVSVFEDTSSATSNESLTPAAWRLTDKQLLEEQPGWLNLDFAREVRLERKLGEGGFGQVFRARWRDEVVAAKLVPFMSVVAHHALPTSLLSAEPSGNSPPRPPSSPASAAAAAADMGVMGVGMQFSAAALRAIKMEIRVLSQLAHPHIVAFRGACLAPPHICILEELAEGGSLWARLYNRGSSRRGRQHAAPAPAAAAAGAAGMRSPRAAARGRQQGRSGGSSRSGPPAPLSLPELLCVARDVACAMQYLHQMTPQVVHRDLKPQNVLLDLQGRAKVCDFGISKMRDASLAVTSTRLQAGTPAYMAPEQFEGRRVSEKVDVYAFGVLLWECCEAAPPWRELSPMQIIYAVGLQGERLPRPAACPDGLWGLIEACWQQEPDDRPGFDEVLETLELLAAAQQQQHAPRGGGGCSKQSGDVAVVVAVRCDGDEVAGGV